MKKHFPEHTITSYKRKLAGKESHPKEPNSKSSNIWIMASYIKLGIIQQRRPEDVSAPLGTDTS